MTVLRATRKLHALLPPAVDTQGDSSGALGDWYVTKFVVDRRPLLMLVSSKSLLAAIEPARDVRNLPLRLASIVAARLHRLGFDQPAIEAELSAMNPVTIGVTEDRSVMGTLVEFCKLVKLRLPIDGWDEDFLPDEEDFLWATPCGVNRRFEDTIFPGEKARELLRARWGEAMPASRDRQHSRVIEIIRADITTLDVDAIVNAANTKLSPGGGVCGAIYRAAGPRLDEATKELVYCGTGDAVVTPGFDLPAKLVIHAVGPVWNGGGHGEAMLLRAAYRNAFRVARKHSVRTIAFPAISTGIFGFPKGEAAAIAVQVMREHEQDFERIVACLFDDESEAFYRGLVP